MGIAQQGWDIELFWATGQTVTAIAAAIALATGKPVTGPFKHPIAVLPKLGHVVGNGQVPESQYFWNINGLRARQTVIALATGSQHRLLLMP